MIRSHSIQERKQSDDGVDNNIYDLFVKIAGDDKEVDWEELKKVLDYSMQADASLPVNQEFTNEDNNPISNNNSNILTTILYLICGAICKNTAISDIIPAPTQGNSLETFHRGFSKDTCRSMIAMLDEDHSGKLGLDEFQVLWTNILNWKAIFLQFDKDRSGTFSGFEIREALTAAGYHLNNRILNALMHRYGNKKGEMNFEDFIMCAIKIKTMIDIFNAKKKETNESVSFTIDEWVEKTVYS